MFFSVVFNAESNECAATDFSFYHVGNRHVSKTLHATHFGRSSNETWNVWQPWFCEKKSVAAGAANFDDDKLG